MTFATNPPGLGLTLDGVPVATPHVVHGVVGFKREIAGAADRGRRRTAPSTTSPAGPTAARSGTSSPRRRRDAT